MDNSGVTITPAHSISGGREGNRLGPYEILVPIGSGAMGEVIVKRCLTKQPA
jgi:hypothetical protein